MFYSNVNNIFLGTDGAASSRVGQILPLQVEGSIPYSAPLTISSSYLTLNVALVLSHVTLTLSHLTLVLSLVLQLYVWI